MGIVRLTNLEFLLKKILNLWFALQVLQRHIGWMVKYGKYVWVDPADPSLVWLTLQEIATSKSHIFYILSIHIDVTQTVNQRQHNVFDWLTGKLIILCLVFGKLLPPILLCFSCWILAMISLYVKQISSSIWNLNLES